MALEGARGLEAPLLQPQGGAGLRLDGGGGGEGEAAPPVTVEQQRPYGSGPWRFLTLHYVPFFAQLWLMRTAWLVGDRLILGCTMGALAFSGLFYSYVAWHAEAKGLCGAGYLPLQKQPFILAVPLLVPYGFMQWVIVNLHLQTDASNGLRADGEDSRFVSYKAINAIVESILTSAAILYTHWTKGLPVDIFRIQDHLLSLVLSEVAIVASGGLGLMQVDFCCSQGVRQRMKYPWYKWLHGLFRTCEVVSRLSILTGFAVMATTKSPWWWLLIAVELGISAYLVLAHGGVRNTGVAIVICIASATIVNVFCFVDSPSRFESAHNVSKGLMLKHAVETALALVFMLLVMDIRLDLSLHAVSLGTAVLATLAYWLLFQLVCHPWRRERDPCDNIFSACRRGDLQRAQQLTTQGEFQFDLDELDISGMTPLMHAAVGGHKELCRHLLAPAQGASPLRRAVGEARFCVGVSRWFWKPAGRKWNAMHFAAWRGHTDVLRELLWHAGELQAEPHKGLDVHGNTPLHIAGQFRHTSAFELIQREGPENWSNLMNDVGETPSPPSDPAFPDIAPPAPKPRPAKPGEEPEAPAARDGMVPVFGTAGPPEVPLGLSSFMVIASSGQVGRSFEPQKIFSDDAETYAVRRHAAAGAEGVRFEGLVPCRADGTRAQEPDGRDLDPRDPSTWERRGVHVGSGTYGHVGRARDEHGNLYAVKVMRKDKPMLHRAALREAQVALAVRDSPHPCLVKALLYHELDEHICVVTKFCSGGTLLEAVQACANNLQRTGQGFCHNYEPEPCFMVWLAEVYLGMEYVHRRMKGIVRDLKPGNVGLHAMGAPARGGQPPMRAMLLDYGSYRLTGPSLGHSTMGGEFQPCSPGYAAPELLRAMPYDQRSDFYSFGALTWVALTGGIGEGATPPFNRKFSRPKDLWNDWKKLRMLVEQAGEFRVPVPPPDAAALILGLTEFSARWRFGAEETRHALGRLLGHDLPMYEAPQAELEAWLAAAEAGALPAGT